MFPYTLKIELIKVKMRKKNPIFSYLAICLNYLICPFDIWNGIQSGARNGPIVGQSMDREKWANPIRFTI